MPKIRGINGEVVVVYCEPLITKTPKESGLRPLGIIGFPKKVNKIGFFNHFISHLKKRYENTSEFTKMNNKSNTYNFFPILFTII